MKALTRKLADAQAQIESLQRERNEAEERTEQCRKDRAMVLNVKTTDGLTASEWLMRTAVAEQKAKDLQTALDAEREKVKGLHEATKVICGHCCESMEIPSKAVLQTQLSQLQALVRALVCTMGYVVDGSYILTRGGVVLYACSSAISAERLGALLAYRATLPATPTEEGT